MLVLLFVALWFILQGDLLYVFPCVIFSVLADMKGLVVQNLKKLLANVTLELSRSTLICFVEKCGQLSH